MNNATALRTNRRFRWSTLSIPFAALVAGCSSEAPPVEAAGGAGMVATGGASIAQAGSTFAGSSSASGGAGGPAAVGGADSTSGGVASVAGSSTGPSGGQGAAGEQPGQAGSGTTVTPQKPEGTIPNQPQSPTLVGLPKTDWKKGLISPTLLKGIHLNQPSVVNGYLVIGGNEIFYIYDVSNPTAPKLISTMKTPGGRGAEAETHTISYARYGNSYYMVTLSGTGIDTWDVTNAKEPKHLGQLKVPGTSYGDYTEAIWGVSWQGQYIYVGATNNGVKVVDAADPAALKIAGEIPTSQYGGVSAGPVDAIGNILVVMTPKESGGIATLDISDPVKPVRLASVSSGKSYIGQFHRHYAFLIGPIRVWDVLTNPKTLSPSPLASLNTEGSEYLSFSDDFLFLGHVRSEIGGTPGASKISVADPKNMKIVDRVWGRQDLGGKNDDQFTLAIGNLLVLGDDQEPYAGWVMGVHQAEPDTKPPLVDTVIPRDATTGVSTKTRIGVTFSDNIELATVNAGSFIVRPVGGQPLPGKFGLRMGVLNFDPDEDLEPGTTYEVVLPKGGIADFVGNALSEEWKSTFTTN